MGQYSELLIRKARKPHICVLCGYKIPKKGYYWFERIPPFNSCKAWSYRAHLLCEKYFRKYYQDKEDNEFWEHDDFEFRMELVGIVEEIRRKTMSNQRRIFNAKKNSIGVPFAISKGETVTLLKSFPKRRALVEWQGKKYLTFSTLLRKIK